MVVRDRDANTDWRTAAGDGVLEERRYFCQDWRHDVCAVLTDAIKMVETVKYSSYGVPFGIPAGDVDANGTWDATDAAAITGGYSDEKDVNLDGVIDASDVTDADAVTGGYQTLGRTVLTSTSVNNRKGYCGYEALAELAGNEDLVRNRVRFAELGRWGRRDPAGYVDGMDLYEYVSGHPVNGSDPSGRAWLPCDSGACPSCLSSPCKVRQTSCKWLDYDITIWHWGIFSRNRCNGYIELSPGCPPNVPGDPTTDWRHVAASVLCAQRQQANAAASIRCPRPCYCESTGPFAPVGVVEDSGDCQPYTVDVGEYSPGCTVKLFTRIQILADEAPGECTYLIAASR